MNNPKRKNTKISRAFIERMDKYMGEKNMTQYDLSIASGIPYPTIKSIMQGRTSDINYSTISLIAYGFGMKPSEFIDDDKFLPENLDLL